jgi:hypothetical protein
LVRILGQSFETLIYTPAPDSVLQAPLHRTCRRLPPLSTPTALPSDLPAMEHSLYTPASASHLPTRGGYVPPPSLHSPMLLTERHSLRSPRPERGRPVLAHGLHAPTLATPNPSVLRRVCFISFVVLGLLFSVSSPSFSMYWCVGPLDSLYTINQLYWWPGFLASLP